MRFQHVVLPVNVLDKGLHEGSNKLGVIHEIIYGLEILREALKIFKDILR